jgi:hypothetical protein
MMNYDLSKTSVENKKVIEEQTEEKNFSCVKNYFRSKNVRFKVHDLSSRKYGEYFKGKYGKYLVVEVSTSESRKIWKFDFDRDKGQEWKQMLNGEWEGKGSFGTGKWECDGNNNFIITKDDGTIYKSSSSNVNQPAAQPTQTVQPVAQPTQTQAKADKKQDTPDPSKPQKLKPKDSPLGTTLKDTSIPKRSCVVYVDQLFEAWERSRGQKFDTNQINELRGYVQRCMDDHFPSGSKQGNWGITGLGGGKTDQKLLQLSACKAPAPSQSGPDSIFRLARKC